MFRDLRCRLWGDELIPTEEGGQHDLRSGGAIRRE